MRTADLNDFGSQVLRRFDGTGVLAFVSFMRKHWLLLLVIVELILAASLTGWLIAGAALGG